MHYTILSAHEACNGEQLTDPSCVVELVSLSEQYRNIYAGNSSNAFAESRGEQNAHNLDTDRERK
jgi:hypothetical protein